MSEETKGPPPKKTELIQTILAGLVATLSILTALIAFLAGNADGASTENFFLAQSYLTDANFFFLQGNQDVLYDFENYDRYVIQEGIDDFASQYYFNQLSDAALDSIDRPDGPFDDEYFTVIYKDGEDLQNLAEDSFEAANLAGQRASRYQLVTLILAVGLSFAAWASLIENKRRIRVFYTFLSIAALALSLLGLLLIFIGNVLS